MKQNRDLRNKFTQIFSISYQQWSQKTQKSDGGEIAFSINGAGAIVYPQAKKLTVNLNLKT